MAREDVLIGLGSNLGDSARILLRAWHHLGEHEAVTLGPLSPPFISSPVDMTSSHWFTNAVGRLEVSCGPYEFLDLLMETEQLLGRLRKKGQSGYQDRSIDLDLLYFGATIMDDPRLTLPHPHRKERLFVLAPLVMVAPDFVDPQTGLGVDQLHRNLIKSIRDRHLAQQEITAVSWPRENGEDRI